MNEDKSSRAKIWAPLASVGTALLGSACCWGPLALVAFGATAGGVAATIASLRPYLLVTSAVFLSFGFYVNYIRKPKACCVTGNPRSRRLSRVLLWVATATAVTIAFSPLYIGFFAGGNTAIVATEEAFVISLRVDGMTCDGCATTIKVALEAVPGVLDVAVSWDQKQADLLVDRTNPPAMRDLVGAVERAGYSATPIDPPTSAST